MVGTGPPRGEVSTAEQGWAEPGKARAGPDRAEPGLGKPGRGGVLLTGPGRARARPGGAEPSRAGASQVERLKGCSTNPPGESGLCLYLPYRSQR